MLVWITGVWLVGVAIFIALIYAHGEQGCSVE